MPNWSSSIEILDPTANEGDLDLICTSLIREIQDYLNNTLPNCRDYDTLQKDNITVGLLGVIGSITPIQENLSAELLDEVLNTFYDKCDTYRILVRYR